jgi:hypothetical protein
MNQALLRKKRNEETNQTMIDFALCQAYKVSIVAQIAEQREETPLPENATHGT